MVWNGALPVSSGIPDLVCGHKTAFAVLSFRQTKLFHELIPGHRLNRQHHVVFAVGRFLTDRFGEAYDELLFGLSVQAAQCRYKLFKAVLIQ